MLKIRKGDLAKDVAGADRGKEGRIIEVDARGKRVRVEKVRMQKRHLKPGRQGARAGGIVEKEMAIDGSNVMPVCPSCGEPSRVGSRIDDEGKKIRVCRNCSEDMDTV